MSRQEEAAQNLEASALVLAGFIESCPDAAWTGATTNEGWTVAALAQHAAVGSDVALGWICQILAQRPVRETPETHDGFNGEAAERSRQVSKAEVLEALRRTTARTAPFLRSLTDEELDRSALLGVASRDVTVGQFIPNFARHMQGHLQSLETALR